MQLISPVSREVSRESADTTREAQAALLGLLSEAEQLNGHGSWMIEHTSNTMLCSPQLMQLLHQGHSKKPDQELRGLADFLFYVHPQDREHIHQELRQSLLTGNPFVLEHRLVLRNGTERLLLHHGETHCDHSGRALHTIACVQDVTHQRQRERDIAAQANRDPLTGLANRNASLTFLEQAIRRSSYNQQIALICLDLDDFQSINDSFSIEAGNQVLCWTAEHLREVVGPDVWVARLESDMFLMILTRGIHSLADGLQQARRLLDSLRSTVPRLVPAIPLQLGACAGVSIAPDHGSRASDLLQCASTALTEAKLRGRQQVEVYSTAMSQRIRERLDLTHRLDSAISRQEMALHYQPQWSSDGTLIGAEVLLRWRTQGGLNIPPSQFIPIAEQSDQINLLGEWVLAQSLQQMRAWIDQELPIRRIAVNVSGRQLESAGDRFETTVVRLLEESGVPPQRLELELTESVLLRDPQIVISCIQRLSALGITMSIDDFGTGFSSMAMLQQLPLNQLKIDRCFVEGITHKQELRSIVKATILMAHELGLVCIAEGVEHPQQLQLLQELGCDNIQGYLLGKPMPADDFQALLKKQQQQLNAAAPDRPLSFQSDSTR